MTPEEIVFLDRLATRISETLYYANDAIHKAHSRADEKFIRHDDYDRLRKMVREAKIAEFDRRHPVSVDG